MGRVSLAAAGEVCHHVWVENKWDSDLLGSGMEFAVEVEHVREIGITHYYTCIVQLVISMTIVCY